MMLTVLSFIFAAAFGCDDSVGVPTEITIRISSLPFGRFEDKQLKDMLEKHLEDSNIHFAANYCNLTASDLGNIKSLFSCITALDLSNNCIGDFGFRVILDNAKKLQHLNLCNNNLGNLSVSYLVKQFKHFESLDLSFNSIDDQGVKILLNHIKNFSGNLTLMGNPISKRITQKSSLYTIIF